MSQPPVKILEVDKALIAVAPAKPSSTPADKRLNERQQAVALLRTLTCNDSIDIAHLDTGRPIVVNGHGEVVEMYNISVSHSSREVVVADSSVCIGIDVEPYNPKALKVSERFINEHEREIINSIVVDPVLAATIAWTIKEAVYKCISSKNLPLCDIIIASVTTYGNGTIESRVIVDDKQYLTTTLTRKDNPLTVARDYTY